MLTLTHTYARISRQLNIIDYHLIKHGINKKKTTYTSPTQLPRYILDVWHSVQKLLYVAFTCLCFVKFLFHKTSHCLLCRRSCTHVTQGTHVLAIHKALMCSRYTRHSCARHTQGTHVLTIHKGLTCSRYTRDSCAHDTQGTHVLTLHKALMSLMIFTNPKNKCTLLT